MLTIKVYQDARGEFRWSAMDGNNEIIADSAEGYKTQTSLFKALHNVIDEFRSDIFYKGIKGPERLLSGGIPEE